MTKFTNIKENLIFNFKALLSSFKILLTNGDSKLFTKNSFVLRLETFFRVCQVKSHDVAVRKVTRITIEKVGQKFGTLIAASATREVRLRFGEQQALVGHLTYRVISEYLQRLVFHSCKVPTNSRT